MLRALVRNSLSLGSVPTSWTRGWARRPGSGLGMAGLSGEAACKHGNWLHEAAEGPG